MAPKACAIILRDFTSRTWILSCGPDGQREGSRGARSRADRVRRQVLGPVALHLGFRRAERLVAAGPFISRLAQTKLVTRIPTYGSCGRRPVALALSDALAGFRWKYEKTADGAPPLFTLPTVKAHRGRGGAITPGTTGESGTRGGTGGGNCVVGNVRDDWFFAEFTARLKPASAFTLNAPLGAWPFNAGTMNTNSLPERVVLAS
jgi:hypothetical protein